MYGEIIKIMIKLLINIVLITIVTTTANAKDTFDKKVININAKLTFCGMTQIVAGTGDGYIKEDSSSNVKFGTDRIRLGWKFVSKDIKGKVLLDFNQPADKKEDVGAYKMVKDAYLVYKFSDELVVKAGIVKTPVGMGFTMSGWNIDAVTKSFDRQLAFDRINGIMVSGRDIGMKNDAIVNGFETGHERPMKGFGYDLMFGNQASRSNAVIKSDENNSEDNAYMARIHFDLDEAFHFEISSGVSPNASGFENSKSYKVLNVGIDSHFNNGKNIKFEYYKVSGIKGVEHKMNTFASTYTQYLTSNVEFIIKDILGYEDENNIKRDVRNTYIGLNYYLNQSNAKLNRMSKRQNNEQVIKINYIATSGDTKDFVGAGNVYKANSIVMLYQFKF
jgi:hypothetical protein